MAWRWDRSVRRYRNENGKFLSRTQALAWAQESMTAGEAITDDLAGLVGDQSLSPDDWRTLMRQEIKDEYIRQYLSGIGGRSMMTQSDWGILGNLLKDQYNYLDGFYDDIAEGKLSDAQIAARARMYIRSARQAHEMAHAKSQGIPHGSLPDYPGSGTTKCWTSCGCLWRIITIYNADKTISHWECFWTLNTSLENCEDCIERAEYLWNPFVVQAETGRSISPLFGGEKRKIIIRHRQKRNMVAAD